MAMPLRRYLQEHPIPLGLGGDDHLLGDGSLSLAERDGVHPLAHAHLGRELLERAERVRARAQDEHQRGRR